MNEMQISQTMEQYVKNGEMVGGLLMVRKKGELLYKNKWGYADPVSKKPIEYNHIFRIASMTKPITAAAVLKLCEKGKLGLDDEVSRYLPQFANRRVVADPRYVYKEMSGQSKAVMAAKAIFRMLTFRLDKVKTVPAERELTVRDLLTHSSGLEMGMVGLILMMKMKAGNDTLAERVDKYARYPLDFQPGKGTGYSPLANWDVLARIVEIVSGMPYDVYLRKEIFDPLGMKDTCFRLSEEQQRRLVPLYEYKKGRLKNVTGTKKDIQHFARISPRHTSAGGGLYSTIDDYDKFAQMLCNEGIYNGVRILRTETVRLMHTERGYDRLEFMPGMAWGLGVLVRENPKRAGSFATQGTYGWSGAFGTHFFISPKDKMMAVFVMNRADIGGADSYISKKVEELVFRIFGGGE